MQSASRSCRAGLLRLNLAGTAAVLAQFFPCAFLRLVPFEAPQSTILWVQLGSQAGCLHEVALLRRAAILLVHPASPNSAPSLPLEEISNLHL